MLPIFQTHLGAGQLLVERNSHEVRITVRNNIDDDQSFTVTNEGARTMALAILDAVKPGNTVEPDPLRYEPETCGVNHLTAERTLRIIEGAALNGNGIPDVRGIQALHDLVAEAGVHLARRSLERGVGFDRDIPF